MSKDIEKNRHYTDSEPELRERKENPDQSTPKIADLFCGAGGISAGFQKSGFDVVLGADIHKPSVDTFQKNHPEASAILGDMKDVEESMLEEAIEGYEVDVLAAGIPCQGFSLANKKQDDEDERNYLFREFMRALDPINPDYILIENVSNIKAAKEGQFVEDIEEALRRKGYNVDHKILCAADYRVPQKRNRMFFLGAKKGNPYSFPEPELNEDEHIGVLEAISDLPEIGVGENSEEYSAEPETEFQKEMRKDSEALTFHTAPNHQQTTVDRISNTEPGEPMYEKFKQRVRLHPDEPSPTLVCGGIRPQFLFGHPTENRGLTVRERARIQSFPDDFEFKSTMVQGRVLTGNAVPVNLSEAFGKSIKKSMQTQDFRDKMMDWWSNNKRGFSWRNESDPYKILVAEMLLRETQAENVEHVYEDFISKFSDFNDILMSDLAEVEDILRPLGLNSERAKAFKDIASKLSISGGKIPDDYDSLTDLPDVGKYIANAVLCFGYDKRRPVVDKHVETALEKIFDLNADEQIHHNDHLWSFVERILPEENYQEFNLALLDLGHYISKGDEPVFVEQLNK